MQLHFTSIPKRVVSLVPSTTESLFDLGLGSTVVGVTDYCVHPAEKLAGLPRLGGTKNPRIDDIVALHPDLVLANMEENTQAGVEALERAGLTVWVTFPTTVSGTLQMLNDLARLFRSPLAQASVRTLELTVEWALQAVLERSLRRYFCPIWQDSASPGNVAWWMTFNQQTYCTDILRLVGGENVFSARRRRYPLAADVGGQPAEDPGDRDVRYPRVTLEEIQSARPELILLPDEPFAFNAASRDEMAHLFPKAQVKLLDGSLITWPGTRMARALRELPPLFDL